MVDIFVGMPQISGFLFHFSIFKTNCEKMSKCEEPKKSVMHISVVSLKHSDVYLYSNYSKFVKLSKIKGKLSFVKIGGPCNYVARD